QAFVRRLDEATKIFNDQRFAEELIRDVQQHQATTVAELLAFMRKYRLMFADAGDSPEVVQQYEALYQLLQTQKGKLGLPKVPPGGLAAVAAENPAEVALFNGKDLTGWTTFQNGRPAWLGSNLIANRGEIYCPPKVGPGRLQTEKSFSNFILKLEYF